MTPEIANPQSLKDRLADLDRMATETFPDGTRGWLAGAIREGIIRKLEEDRAAQRTVAQQIEAVLTSGLTGAELCAALRTHFGQATRADVFLGVALAITVMEARVTLAETEMKITRLEGAQ